MENIHDSYIKLDNRKKCEISGVKKLDGFDEKDFYFDTTLGYMHIKGKKMGLTNMDSQNGVLVIEGEIDSISYVNKNTNNSFFAKLFK